MGTVPVYFCWHCYGQTDNPGGPCPHCGQPVAPPPRTDYTDRLLWALNHPLPETRLTAARVLGRRRATRAAEPLRELALSADDPYLAATALESLVRVQGVITVRPVLELLATHGAAPVRRLAKRLLHLSNIQLEAPASSGWRSSRPGLHRGPAAADRASGAGPSSDANPYRGVLALSGCRAHPRWTSHPVCGLAVAVTTVVRLSARLPATGLAASVPTFRRRSGRDWRGRRKTAATTTTVAYEKWTTVEGPTANRGARPPTVPADTVGRPT
ncbi:HEAT repeat domain-containing protein [Streptomyces sp. NPDC048385]|uniref:HEAT repeat domain-containing protein n=1 Tax=unclassified Streptomyces TaxID=2593676 RepID=UPI00341ED643